MKTKKLVLQLINLVYAHLMNSEGFNNFSNHVFENSLE